jgi:molybdenum cofactor synthesis domain-containing protein
MKKISFLATGNELIEGDTQDTNGTYFARSLHDRGARIYQHMLVSDTTSEIVDALRYLLAHSDAVITCGGMGPTSDDNTRYAVSECTGETLVFHEPSWEAIEERFQRFHLKLVPSNRQQALFPEGSTVYPNQHGSAPACYFPWENKHIFMLPGPPKECRPIFDTQIIPQLQALDFFQPRHIFRWLTLGLSESEIAETIDALAKKRGFETGYRWSYPYLEIKIIAENETPDLSLIAEANYVLNPYCISRDRKDATETLKEKLRALDKIIYIDNAMVDNLDPEFMKDPHLIYMDKNEGLQRPHFFSAQASPLISLQLPETQRITFSAQGYVHEQPRMKHRITLPCRGPEVILAAQAYFAWQLAQFIQKI